LGIPGGGLVHALGRLTDTGTIMFWVAVSVLMSVALLVWARRDLLAWVALAFAAFGSLLGPDVWITNAGYQRALVPLFYFAPIALLGALPSLARTDHNPVARFDAQDGDPVAVSEPAYTGRHTIEADERDDRPVAALGER
jgi:hypothetical protein